MKVYVKDLDEPVLSMATVGVAKTPVAMKVKIDPDRLREGDAYFKVYLGKNESAATALDRICFDSPKYILHRDDRTGLVHKDLKRKEKEALVEFLTSRNTTFSKYSNWDIAKYHWNHEHGLFDDFELGEFNSDVEAYMSGYFDSDNLTEPSYLPSTLEMPNYLEL